MPLTCAEYATDFACSNARFSASTVLMSGFGAPRRTAMPMLERARSTRLAATTLPSLINSSMPARLRMMTSTGSPRRTRLAMESGPIPVDVASVTTV